GLLATMGGFVTAAFLPSLRAGLAEGLRGAGGLPYYPIIAGACLAAAAPVIVPLGGLLGIAAGTGRRTAFAALLLGGAVGLLLAPYFCEVLFGGGHTLQVAALLAGAAS